MCYLIECLRKLKPSPTIGDIVDPRPDRRQRRAQHLVPCVVGGQLVETTGEQIGTHPLRGRLPPHLSPTAHNTQTPAPALVPAPQDPKRAVTGKNVEAQVNLGG